MLSRPRGEENEEEQSGVDQLQKTAVVPFLKAHGRVSVLTSVQ